MSSINLLTVKDAAEYLDISVDRIYVQSCSNPTWYIKNGKTAYVDIEKYLFQRRQTLKYYNYNTSCLYWLMKELSVTDRALSEWMAKKSKVYKAAASWRTFIQFMFAIPMENGVEIRDTMHSEFYKISTKTIRVAKRRGYKFENIYS